MTHEGAKITILKNKWAFSRNLVFVISTCFVVGLGAALRIHDLGAEGYELDEVDTVLMAQASLQQIITDPGGRPQLYLLLAHFWVQAWGTSEAATRSLSALAGIASILLMLVVGSELFGRRVGLISGFFMAVSEFQIYYSQDFRYYALFVLLTLASYWLYIRALKSGKPGHFFLYALATVLLLYTQTVGVFVLAAQGLYFLLQWRRYRSFIAWWFLSLAVIVLAFVPGLVLFMKEAGNTIGWIPDPPLWRPFLTVAKFVFPLTVIHSRPYPSWGVILTGIAFLGIGVALCILWKGREQWFVSIRNLVPSMKALSSAGNELQMVGCWLLCPILLPFIFSKLVMPMYLDRYAISAAPALYLLLALSVVTVRKIVPEAVLLGVFVILIALGLRGYYVTDVKEEWRQSAAYVAANSQNGDVIVFAPDNGRSNGFNWYYRGSLPECSLDQGLADNQAISAALATCLSDAKRFWVIMRGPEHLIMPLRAFFVNPNSKQMHLEKAQEFMGISVYLFTVPEH